MIRWFQIIELAILFRSTLRGGNSWRRCIRCARASIEAVNEASRGESAHDTGSSDMAAWLDSLSPDWQALLVNMKRRREERKKGES
jgi:hypothetical protein